MLILFLAVGFLPACAAESPIPQEHQTILKGDWTPTQHQTDKALAAAVEYVHQVVARNNGRNLAEKMQVFQAKQISEGMKQYYVQFIGQTPRGVKIIFCNFISGPDSDWKKSLVVFYDGGSGYWQIDYNPETGKCRNFDINGLP